MSIEGTELIEKGGFNTGWVGTKERPQTLNFGLPATRETYLSRTFLVAVLKRKHLL